VFPRCAIHGRAVEAASYEYHEGTKQVSITIFTTLELLETRRRLSGAYFFYHIWFGAGASKCPYATFRLPLLKQVKPSGLIKNHENATFSAQI